jgi:predicted 2-oxoglutarate/Fe(II)-dependent dioxygenase YbiX
MAHHSFLRQLGVFTIPQFLTPTECERWRVVADAQGGKEARVYLDNSDHVNDEQRKTLEVNITNPIQSAIQERVNGLREQLETHFKFPLAKMDLMRCLVYRPGDFFRLHADAPDDCTTATAVRYRSLALRRVTIVVFLNAPGSPLEPYKGGGLSLYGLMGTQSSESFGFPVDAESGLLIAFPSSMMHEVSVVTAGKRYTLVTWFLTQEPEEVSYADHDNNEAEAPG